MSDETVQSGGDDAPPRKGEVIKRQRLSTRIWHWVNFAALIVMFMSGLMIFNAHPRLYWGQYGANPDPAWLEIGQDRGEGYLRIGDAKVETTGLLGVWKDEQGQRQAWAFPDWITIPSGYSLAGGRRWHFAFAWVVSFGLLFYMLWSLFNRHIWRDLRIRGREWRPSHIWRDIRAHARLRFDTGKPGTYNILQKLSYIGVIFIALPLMVLTGLTMSPQMNAPWGFLLDIFGGRQSARSIHFITCWALVAFFAVHITMVILAGPVNELRSIITGRYRLPKRGDEEERA